MLSDSSQQTSEHTVQVALCSVTLILSIFVFCPLAFLFGFHVYLMRSNLTTLQYLRRKRQSESTIVTKTKKVATDEGETIKADD